jgi:hypothetical protein
MFAIDGTRKPKYRFCKDSAKNRSKGRIGLQEQYKLKHNIK